MKIAAVVDEEGRLKPLDAGKSIAIIYDGKVSYLQNPGFGLSHGGKELAMDVILKNAVDAVIAKRGFLCPCSYKMSLGRLKYLNAQCDNIDDLISGKVDVAENLLNELEPNVYAEKHDLSSKVHLRFVNV